LKHEEGYGCKLHRPGPRRGFSLPGRYRDPLLAVPAELAVVGDLAGRLSGGALAQGRP
jgi:hypothetical protein